MIIAVNFPVEAIRKKPDKKKQGFNGIQTRDLCDTGANYFIYTSQDILVLVRFAFLHYRLLLQFINRNKHLLFCCGS